jgi:DNA invertase Pin-like site-specific DNA recombinase
MTLSQAKYVTYCRVSTRKQGSSGLGLEAQQSAINMFLKERNGARMAEFVEVESGRKNDRPQLQRALKRCRATGATLLIAKLDRLSRSVYFVSQLQESKVRFTCCDMPDVNETMIQMLAVMAEAEAKAASQRTLAALRVARANGKVLGRHDDAIKDYAAQGNGASAAARCDAANKHATNLEDMVRDIEQEAAESNIKVTLRFLAQELTSRGALTPRNGTDWTPMQVSRVLARL